MTWLNYPIFALITTLIWIIGVLMLSIPNLRIKYEKIALITIALGWMVFATFIVLLWTELDRPPMRTLGETRLWYAGFLPIIGLITYQRWKYSWFLIYTVLMALIFLFFNYLHPETYSKTLMPALQSVWFVPHVLVYLIAYAVLAASSIVAIKNLWHIYKKEENKNFLDLADNLVYIGFSFLTLGLLFGALWAKQAWGHYWTWDPKEVWAFLTWMGYLIYIHYRHFNPIKTKAASLILALAFVILLLCWFWLNISPVAQNSVHTYTKY